MDLGKLGVWYFFDGIGTEQATAAAQRIESMGYGTLWLPETVGKDPLTTASWFLANTKTLNLATGIVNIYNREPGVMLAAQRTLAEQSSGRFALAMGVSHKPLVEGVRGLEYGPPVATMRSYLEKMSASIFNVILETDASKARELARPVAKIYQKLPNYRNNWLRMGMTEQDIDDLSDRFIDATFAWGSADAIKARVQEHIDAGADHVCVQPVNPNGQFGDLHWDCLEAITG